LIFAPGKPLSVEFVHADGSKHVILANHTYNQGQIDGMLQDQH
jgi:aconitate hydratase